MTTDYRLARAADPTEARYAVVQGGYIGRERYATREDAQVEADRLNAEADEECGHEVMGDGAAAVIEVWP